MRVEICFHIAFLRGVGFDRNPFHVMSTRFVINFAPLIIYDFFPILLQYSSTNQQGIIPSSSTSNAGNNDFSSNIMQPPARLPPSVLSKMSQVCTNDWPN